MMRAILIDPFTQTIEEVDYSGDYKDIYALIDCEIFSTLYVDRMDTLYIDDEGLYVEDQRYFKIGLRGQPLAGKALVLGTDDNGESVDCASTLKSIQEMVEWCPEGMSVEPQFGFQPMEEDVNLDTLSDKDLIDLIFGERVLH